MYILLLKTQQKITLSVKKIKKKLFKKTSFKEKKKTKVKDLV